MSAGLGFAAIVFSFPVAAGLFNWLTGLSNAAEVNAKARLLEAENARRALDQNRGGEE